MVLVSLKITDRAGKAVSDTVYWRGKDEAAYRALNAMAPAPLGLAAAAAPAEGGERQATITLTNHGSTPRSTPARRWSMRPASASCPPITATTMSP
jgi:hypothetical protein